MKKAIATEPGQPTKYVELTNEEKSKRQAEEQAYLDKINSLEYRQDLAREKRRKKYKPVEDQLDDLWHAMDRGELAKVEPFYSDNAAVKSSIDIPKE